MSAESSLVWYSRVNKVALWTASWKTNAEIAQGDGQGRGYVYGMIPLIMDEVCVMVFLITCAVGG